MTTNTLNLMKPAEAAAELRISVKTLHRWIDAGHGPPVILVAGGKRATIRIDREDFEAWVQSLKTEQ